jgi:hypothetical protein
MKTFKQHIKESAEGDELYDLKLRLAEWWKKNSRNPEFKSRKTSLTKLFNTMLDTFDQAVDLVYEAEPEKKQ